MTEESAGKPKPSPPSPGSIPVSAGTPSDFAYTDAMLSALLLKSSRSIPEGNAQEQSIVEAVRKPPGEWFVCANCRSPITDASDRCAIQGKTAHTFANPSGAVFQIGCFSTAVNIRISGLPTSEFTWFPGYLWQGVICAICGTHLGWQFTSENRFFGLIMNRLVSISTSQGS
jgi:hypothetical protein